MSVVSPIGGEREAYMNKGSLAGFVSRNPGGRAFFLTAPVAIAAALHVAVYALTGEPLLGACVGGLGAVIAAAVLAWLYLDEDAAVALERKYERGALYAWAAAIPLLFVSPYLMAGAMAAGMVSFGASLGIVRISAYVDAPDAPAPVDRLSSLAWLTQMAAITAVLAASTPITAALAAALAILAVAASTFLKKEEDLTVIC